MSAPRVSKAYLAAVKSLQPSAAYLKALQTLDNAPVLTDDERTAIETFNSTDRGYAGQW